MIIQQSPTFLPQAAGQKAVCKLPRYALTLTRFMLRLGGTTLTKALLDRVVVRIGTHIVWDVTGSELDKINKYKGLYDDEFHLTLDFTERDATDIVGKEIGGIDLSKLNDDVYVEIDINSSASAPTLGGRMFLTPPQGDDKDQLIKKFVKKTSPSLSAGVNDIDWNPMGALLQRAYVAYGSTDWAASAAATAFTGNTGDGAMGAITVSAGAKIGIHRIVIVEPGANVGTFIHEDPDGILVSKKGVVATAYSAGGLAFTLADGATDFLAGDGFELLVSKASNGNVSSLLVKKNGVPIHEDVSCVDNRFVQREYNKKPQSRMYIYDPIVDNNQSGAVITADAASFQIRPTLTGSDTLTTIFEVLDKPYNL